MHWHTWVCSCRNLQNKVSKSILYAHEGVYLLKSTMQAVQILLYLQVSITTRQCVLFTTLLQRKEHMCTTNVWLCTKGLLYHRLRVCYGCSVTVLLWGMGVIWKSNEVYLSTFKIARKGFPVGNSPGKSQHPCLHYLTCHTYKCWPTRADTPDR